MKKLLTDIGTMSTDLAKMMDQFMNRLDAVQDVAHEHWVMWTKINSVYVSLKNKLAEAKKLVAEKIAKKEKLKEAIQLKATFASLEAEFRKLEALWKDLLNFMAEFGHA